MEVGRRERKKQHTRDELIAAAVQLFGERGFDETTTADIAEAADVSQRTFFRHFASKEAVLYGDEAEVAAAFGDAIRSRPANEDPITAVAASFRALTQHYSGEPNLTLLQGQLAARYPSVSAYSRAVVQRGLERTIIEALAERMGVTPTDDSRPEVIAGAAMSAFRYALRKWVASRGKSDLLELAANALTSLR